MAMTIRYRTEEGILRVSLEGEIDHHEAIRLMERLRGLVEDHLPGVLELDLTDLAFMDSSGIAVVVQTARAMARCGGTLSVVNTPPQAKKVLTCAGIHRMVDIR